MKMRSFSECSRRCSREMPVPSRCKGLSGPRPSVTASSSRQRALVRLPLSREDADTISSTLLHDLIEIPEQLAAQQGVASQELDQIAPLGIGESDSQAA